MAKKKLFKSKTNFSLRRLHQSGNFGSIYERDYTTIVNSLDNPGGQIPILNSPSFKLSINNSANKRKRYLYGSWEDNPTTMSKSWTLENILNSDENGNKVKVETYGKRLTDYVCYGSSYELIKTSIRNIITKFPSEIYVTNRKLRDTGIFDLVNDSSNVSTGSTMFDYIDYYVVDNPMYIDIVQNSVSTNSVINPLRYICNSIYEYDIMYHDGTIISSGDDFKKWNEKNDIKLYMWEVLSPTSDNDKTCLINGDLIAKISFNKIDKGSTKNVLNIFCFYLDGDLIYLSDKNNIRIRPNKYQIDEFFNNLNDFEKKILNRNTNYTSIFETYYETDENGWQICEKEYTWPTSDGEWNIAINGLLYSKFTEDLMVLSNGYDELFTNAIHRDMIHESINNMDMTGGIVIENDEYVFNSNKISKVLNVVGRQFDEIKKICRQHQTE